MKSIIKRLILNFESFYHKNQFITSFWSIFLNPFFISRHALYRFIKKRSIYFNGVYLDYGCGTMPYKSLFNYDKYIGIDYGDPKNNNDKIIFTNDDLIPFNDNFFDSIICTENLEHVSDIDKTLSELYRVLKPGGKILITMPFAWIEHPHPHDYRRLTVEGLTSILIKHNFKLLEIYKTTSTVLSITQLWANVLREKLYIYKYYNIFVLIYNIFIQTFFIVPVFLLGYFCSLLITDKKKPFPLNIIIIAEK